MSETKRAPGWYWVVVRDVPGQYRWHGTSHLMGWNGEVWRAPMLAGEWRDSDMERIDEQMVRPAPRRITVLDKSEYQSLDLKLPSDHPYHKDRQA